MHFRFPLSIYIYNTYIRIILLSRSNQWTLLKRLPTTLSSHACGVVTHKMTGKKYLVVAGGFSRSSQPTNKDTVRALDLDTLQWETSA